MDITLDAPAQISMWVLLSRRHQLQMHLKGLRVPGIVKWCRENIEGAGRTARACVVPVEYAIAQAGGNVSYDLVNAHVLVNRGGMLFDQGIYPNMAAVEANPKFVQWYNEGILEIVLTLDEPRDATSEIFIPA